MKKTTIIIALATLQNLVFGQNKITVGIKQFEVGSKTATIKLTDATKKNLGNKEFYLLKKDADTLVVSEIKYDSKNKIEAFYTNFINLKDINPDTTISVITEKTLGSFSIIKDFYSITFSSKSDKKFTYYEYADVKEEQNPSPTTVDNFDIKFSDKKEADKWLN